MPSNQSAHCSQCQQPLTVGSSELVCPECRDGLKALLVNETEGTASVKPNVQWDTLAASLPDRDFLRTLGSGGMGQVFLVRHRRLDRLEALKVLLPDFAENPRFMQRFMRESKVLARLRHPNIVSIHDCSDLNGLLYILMEFVDGESLREVIARGALTVEERIDIVAQIGEAMRYAHKAGVIHRDLKPGNILLSKGGEVKVVDFGLGKEMTKGKGNVSLTGPREIMGTPGYMAPEQSQSVGEVDFRSDIYSVGVVAYELMTGRMPCGVFRPLSSFASVSRKMDEVIHCALSQEPETRYENAGQFLSAWQEASRETRLMSHRDPEDESSGAASPSPKAPLSGKKALAGVVGFLIISSMVACGWFLSDDWPGLFGFGSRAAQKLENLNASSLKGAIKGDQIVYSELGMEFKWVEEGLFTIGQTSLEEDDSHPILNAEISYGFWMGKYEVTQLQFLTVMGFNPSRFNHDYVSSLGGESSPTDWQERPVEQLTWRNAYDFCERLTEMAYESDLLPSNYRFRLPSELEWEYVCRAGGLGSYVPGSDLSVIREMAWCSADFVGMPETRMVGKKQPNAWGFHDFLGNVSEFCLDHYWNYESYVGRTMMNWISLDPCGGDRMVRGGYYEDDPGVVTSTLRYATSEDEVEPGGGLRVVLSEEFPSIRSVLDETGKAPIKIESLGLVLHWIPSGEFMMGEPSPDTPRGPDVFPVTPVLLTSGFWMATTEITESQYQRETDSSVRGLVSSGTAYSIARRDLPMANVTWNQAAAFCINLTDDLAELGDLPEGMVVRLPTEAEWEWACRRCFDSVYHFGGTPGEQFVSGSWYVGNSSGAPGPVAGKSAGLTGLFGLYGNVREWCLDSEYRYSGSREIDLVGVDQEKGGALKVVRGGDFLSPPELCTGTRRSFLPASESSPFIGFRVVIGTPMSLQAE